MPLVVDAHALVNPCHIGPPTLAVVLHDGTRRALTLCPHCQSSSNNNGANGLTGQWWSYLSTHRLHILQWCALSGSRPHLSPASSSVHATAYSPQAASPHTAYNASAPRASPAPPPARTTAPRPSVPPAPRRPPAAPPRARLCSRVAGRPRSRAGRCTRNSSVRTGWSR